MFSYDFHEHIICSFVCLLLYYKFNLIHTLIKFCVYVLCISYLICFRGALPVQKWRMW